MVTLLAVFVVCLWTGTVSAHAQGTVKLINLFRPLTAFEVGNTPRIEITGASPNGTVTYDLKCTPPQPWCSFGPHTVGMTDASGNASWNFGSYQPEHAGISYEEHWWVTDQDGLRREVTPAPISPYLQ